MNKIISRRDLNSHTTQLTLDAPLVAKKASPGQFIILRTNEDSERIPLSICDSDKDNGTIDIIVRSVGETTRALCAKKAGDVVSDVVGPLGKRADMSGESILIVCDEVGIATALPMLKEYAKMGKFVFVAASFADKQSVILDDEIEKYSNAFSVQTDNRSIQKPLTKILENGKVKYDVVRVFGKLNMMKEVCALTAVYGIKTVVYMNTMMLDGTGICGGCRLTVAGKIKFACVDGPEFDGHAVDFDEAISRSDMYKEFEKRHACNLLASTEGNDNG